MKEVTKFLRDVYQCLFLGVKNKMEYALSFGTTPENTEKNQQQT
jgi:hypothetical protein